MSGSGALSAPVPAGPASGAPTIGVDVGGTKILGIVLAPDGSVLAEQRSPTPRSAEGLLAAIASTARELAPVTGVGNPPVGVGMPGLVDRTGSLHVAPNLIGGDGLEVRAGLMRLGLGPEVAVENDATCAVEGEHAFGALRGTAVGCMITLGTGIGGGLVVNGNVVLGAHGFAAEVGHMVVVEEGRPCPCGQRGCWEQYASGNSLGDMGREAVSRGRAAAVLALAGGAVHLVRGEHVTSAARDGDSDALALIGEYATWVAVGLANLINIIDPEIIVVGGGLAADADLMLDPIRAATSGRPEGAGIRSEVPIVVSELGDSAGAVGAAVFARTRAMERRETHGVLAGLRSDESL